MDRLTWTPARPPPPENKNTWWLRPLHVGYSYAVQSPRSDVDPRGPPATINRPSPCIDLYASTSSCVRLWGVGWLGDCLGICLEESCTPSMSTTSQTSDNQGPVQRASGGRRGRIKRQSPAGFSSRRTRILRLILGLAVAIWRSWARACRRPNRSECSRLFGFDRFGLFRSFNQYKWVGVHTHLSMIPCISDTRLLYKPP